MSSISQQLQGSKTAEVQAPPLPPGEDVELADRGHLFVRRAQGPPDAPVVMLLHGWTVTADLNWYPAYEPLSQRYNVLAFDHRGHGLGLRSRRRFRLDDCAQDALAVADAVGVDRFICVGYSMGGAVAQLVARAAPERVSGLVLGATAARFRGGGMAAARFAILPVVATAARLVPGAVRQRVFDSLLRGAMGENLGAWARAEIHKADPQALLDAGTALFNFDSTDWVGSLPMPVAQVRTLGDLVVPDEQQQALSDAVPHMSMHAYEGGHDSVVADFAQFWRCLQAALEAVRQPAGVGQPVA